MEKFSNLPYSRPDFEALKSDFEKLIHQFEIASTAEYQIEIIKKINDIRVDFSTAMNIAYVRNSINTVDEFYDAERAYFDEAYPLMQDLVVIYYKALNASKFKATLEATYGKQLFDLVEVSVRSFSPEVIADLQEINAFSSEYSKQVSLAKIEFDGKTLNLAGMDPYMQSTDRAVRKNATLATYGWWEKNATMFDDIYDKMVKKRHAIAQKLGYENFVQLGYDNMGRTDYNAKDVAAFRAQVLKHIVPFTVELRKKQAERIGVDNLKIYDVSLSYTSGNPTPKGNPDWILANGEKMYSEMSPETKIFFDMMVENELLDLVNKPNKQGGGYCTSFSKYKVPFIFSNFNGTSHDVDVLTHEAGHAFQNWESRNWEIEEYGWPTSEACEIHSMGMEFFAWPWMENFFKEDTAKYKFSHLSGALLFIPYGCAVDEFQHVVYENPTMTPDERNKAWREIDAKYRPYIDFDNIDYLEKGGFWKRQAHIYNSPFYYIDYCLAQLCALQFWKKSQEDRPTAWQDYLTLCQAGGSQSFLNLVKLAKLNNPFDENTIKPVVESVKNWLSTIDDKKL